VNLAGSCPIVTAVGPDLHGKFGQPMSALPPKADIAERDWHVRFVPMVDIPRGYTGVVFKT
jgi:hypothetical protein